MDAVIEQVSVTPARFVRPKLAATIIGLTLRAIERKIQSGAWVEGKQYRKGPDGLIYVDLRGYEQWVTGGRIA